VDDICFIRSVYTDIPNHEPSMLMMNTGHSQVGRPSIGSWLTYGLGTENKNLPGYVVLCPDVPTTVGPPLWNNAFLPAVHQGTYISDKVLEKQTESLVDKKFDPKKAIAYIYNDKFSLPEQRREMDLLEKLDRMRIERESIQDPQLDATIKSMETAYRMQTEAPEVFDIRKESEATLKLYGPGSTARGCLLAVRLAEKGVRMVQVYYAKGDPWDARLVQGHAGDLRIGIRSDASCRGWCRRRRAERARSQSFRIHHVAGRRRRERRNHLRRHRRIWI
jgi:hypothetical protein